MRYLILLAVALLPACNSTERVSRKSDIRVEMILPQSAEHVELETHQTLIPPVPVKQPLPAFPAEYPAQEDFKIAICSELIISGDGVVVGDQSIDDAPACEPTDSAQSSVFYPEVRKAVQRWSFIGAAICDDTDAAGDCDESAAPLRPIAVKLAYRFEFTASNGNHAVIVHSPQNP